MNELKPEDVRRALAWYEVVGKNIGSVTLPYDELKAIAALLREKDAEIKELTDDNKWSAKRIIETDKLVSLLKSEVERLNKANQNFAELENGYIVTGYKNIRAEAITEFAHRLKTFYGHLNGKTVGGSVKYHIDQIVKEMGADTCVCCGDVIPEGRQVCPNCERKDDESG
jgi:hypothetical protein